MLAVHNYADFKGKSAANPDKTAEMLFPTGCIGPGADPEARLSWIVALLPYLDQESLYRQFDLEKGHAGNTTAAQTKINVLICPTAKDRVGDAVVTTYIAMAGIGSDAAALPAEAAGIGFMGYDRLTTEKMIADGTSNTIGLMETHTGLGSWARGGASTLRGFIPSDVPLFGDSRQFADHESRPIVAYLDGSVRAVSASVDPSKLAAAITIAGKEAPVDLD